jgi:hypothetical protein
VYCQVGQRGYLATRVLRHAGFEAANVGGGYTTYRLFRPTAACASTSATSLFGRAENINAPAVSGQYH